MSIFVAIHKPGPTLRGNYIPIHLGRAVSQYKSEMEGMIGDDTGDNIVLHR